MEVNYPHMLQVTSSDYDPQSCPTK